MKRKAFTLVELLVVIAIIGVLVALLLPAVQAAREAARRMACTNKLKQLGIAVHNYHDNYSALTSASNWSFGPTTAQKGFWSGLVGLLPFIEMQPVYDRFLTTTVGTTNWHTTTSDISATYGGADSPLAAKISTYFCPSDPAYATKPNLRQSGTNYRFNYGDYPCGWSGTSPTIDANRGHRGTFGSQTHYNLSAVTDGTSNTLMMSERCLTEYSKISTERTATRATLITGGTSIFGVSAYPRVLISRKACFESATLNQYDENPVADSGRIVASHGWAFAVGTPWHSTISTILPPNAPSCAATDGPSYNSMITPSSYHNGGVNAVQMDGAVRFVPNTIDVGTGDRFPSTTPSGDVGGFTSVFGVWGAYGSRSGGESETF